MIRYSIPSNYASITIGQYQDWHAAKNDIHRAAAATGIHVKKVKLFPAVVIDTICQQFSELLKAEQSQMEQSIKVGKERLYLIPDMYKMSMDEFVDASVFCTNMIPNIHKFMGVFYRPVKYKIGKYYRLMPYDSNDRALYDDAMRKVSMATFNGLMAFFLTLHGQLTTSSLQSFQHQTTQSLKEMTSLLREAHSTDGVGTDS